MSSRVVARLKHPFALASLHHRSTTIASSQVTASPQPRLTRHFMGDDSDNYDSDESSEWEEVDIPSRWIWEKADVVRPIGGKGAKTSHLSLCQRREKRDPRFEAKLYVRKLLSERPGHGMKYIKREVDMLQKCEHWNILRYEDFSYSPGSWDDPSAKLYTEYCAKGDLDQFTDSGRGSNRGLSVEQGIQVFSQIAQALLYIHHGISLAPGGLPYTANIHAAQGSRTGRGNDQWKTILHRDIKPQNSQSQNNNIFVVCRHDADRRRSLRCPARGTKHTRQTRRLWFRQIRYKQNTDVY